MSSPAQTKASLAADRADEAMTWPLRLLAAVVSLVVLAVAGVICLVVIGSQIGFYELNLKVKSISFAALGIDTPLHLPTFTPLATEGLVWATTLLALVMVLLGRTATLWTRSMWFFASVAAFVATWHTVTAEGDLFGGVLRGSLSLAGPFLVHLFILWARHLRTGRTLTQARIDTAARWSNLRAAAAAIALLIGRHIAHPVIALRALSYRLGVAHWSYGDAWVAASVGYRRRVQQRLETRHTGGFKRLQPHAPEATEETKSGTAEPLADEPGKVPPPAGVSPAFIDGEVARIAAWLNDPELTADAFVDLREPATEGNDRQATETATDRRPKSAQQATDDKTGTRPRTADKPTEGARTGDRPRPVGRAKRPSIRRPKAAAKATDVDVSDLLPVAREVAIELGDRLNRDALLDGLRDKGHRVGGRRRAAIYNAIRAEREK